VWNGRDARKEEQWENNFDQLIAFKEKHGHFNMKSCGEEYQALWNWTMRQKTSRRKLIEGTIDLKDINLWKKRVERLDQVGFEWSAGGSCSPRKPLPTKHLPGGTEKTKTI